MLIVLTTVGNASEGEALAEKLVGAGLGACVQILPQITSVYVWNGKLQKENEHLLIIKTLPEKWNELRDFITANHSYEVPEIVAVDAEKISGPYQTWLTDVLMDNGKRTMEN